MESDKNRCQNESLVRDVFNRYRGDLRRVVKVRLDSRLAARFDPSDVLQDVMMQAFPHVTDWIEDDDKSVYACLYTLTRDHLSRLHRDHVRTQRRTVGKERMRLQINDESIGDLAKHFATARSTPSQRLARVEQQTQLRLALEQLREADREVLVMRVLEGMSVRDVSQVMAISEAAVKMRHLRAIERLRTLMDVDGAGDA